MKTLYDLLGARPDDDAEGLKSAFRKAAKANHPDLHAGDPDAPVRFRQIVAAYDILRNAEERATYDRLVAFECEQLRSQSKRAISYFMYNIVVAVAAVGFGSVLAGGYTLLTHISKAPVEAVKVVGVAAKVATVEGTARNETTEPSGRDDKLERVAVPDMPVMMPSAVALATNDGGAPEATKGTPFPSPAGLNTEDAKTVNAIDVPMDTVDAKTAADHTDQNHRIEPRGHDQAQSADIQFSSTEQDDVAPKSPLSDFAMSYDKRHMTITGTAKVNAGDMKVSETRMTGRPSTAVKRPSGSRTPLTQALLENRSTPACPGLQSCSGDLPPLFGVGF